MDKNELTSHSGFVDIFPKRKSLPSASDYGFSGTRCSPLLRVGVEWIEKLAVAPDRLQCVDFGAGRPLSGIKVLDMTRVLAGPVATRTLARFGAQVLRIGTIQVFSRTPQWVRCAELNLTNSNNKHGLKSFCARRIF